MALKGNITTLSKLSGPEEQKAQIFKDLGDLSQYELLDDHVIVAIYAESNVLASGKRADGTSYTLIGTENRSTESRYQGKCGVLISKGPTAFKYHNNGAAYEGVIPEIGDWVVFYPSDGRELFLHGLHGKGENVTCRKFHWQSISMRVTDPRVVY
jgi:hypothetical protein